MTNKNVKYQIIDITFTGNNFNLLQSANNYNKIHLKQIKNK